MRSLGKCSPRVGNKTGVFNSFSVYWRLSSIATFGIAGGILKWHHLIATPSQIEPTVDSFYFLQANS